MAGLQSEFAKRNCKIIGLSVDPASSHSKWAADIEETQGHKVNYPMIGDPELKVAKLYDMLPAEAGTTSEGRTAANNATVRTVFVVGPDKKIKLMLIYPMSTGRNFDEVLRVLDSIQLTAKHQVATPVNWKPGRGRDHRAVGLGRRRKEEIPGRLEGAQALPADRPAAEVRLRDGERSAAHAALFFVSCGQRRTSLNHALPMRSEEATRGGMVGAEPLSACRPERSVIRFEHARFAHTRRTGRGRDRRSGNHRRRGASRRARRRGRPGARAKRVGWSMPTASR